MSGEVKIYEQYEDFVDRINRGKISEFYLTGEMPTGTPVLHGEPKWERPNGLIAKILFERELKKENVINVGITTSGPIYAVNKDFKQPQY